MTTFNIGDRVMVMLGEDHPSQGVVQKVKGTKVLVLIEVLWPPSTHEKWYDYVELMKTR